MFLEFGNTIYELSDSFFSSEKQQQQKQYRKLLGAVSDYMVRSENRNS